MIISAQLDRIPLTRLEFFKDNFFILSELLYDVTKMRL